MKRLLVTVAAVVALSCVASTRAVAAPFAEFRGTVFVDANGNGRLDAGERGISGVAVSDQLHVVVTDKDGRYRLPDGAGDASGVVFVSVPDGYRATDSFFHAVTRSSTASIDFALVDSIKPAFVIITGDLVRDALRVGEAEATGYCDLFQSEAAKFTRELWTVPGNHENFGIERDKSGVSASHPLYGRAMYRQHCWLQRRPW